MTDAVKDRVLAASLALITERGVAALSMREVARRANVSHQAPYHYFEDKEAIIAALVEQGYDRLTQRMIEASHAKKADHTSVAIRSARAYVDFALDEPAYFRVMFRPDIVDENRFPAMKAAGDRSFEILESLVAELAPAHTPAKRAVLMSVIWAEVHGLATLLVDGKLAKLWPDRKERERHIQQVLTLFVERVLAP